MGLIRPILLPLILVLGACTSGSDKPVVWVYTSLYKDTIADIKPKLKEAFPNIDIRFYQAGSEDIAAKVNTEIMAGRPQADILISSDRFWYEELAGSGRLAKYDGKKAKTMPANLRHPEGYYHTLSLPVMVLAYNKEGIKGLAAPSAFKEMAEQKWQGKFTTGSPLASGTNFTTVAFLAKAYGWDFFKALQKNSTISEGGNSAVLRRIQGNERPVGWVLLENMLRLKGKDKRLKVVFPDDGVVLQNNVLAITKKNDDRLHAKQVADWLFADHGQNAMLRSYMYSPFPSMAAPEGAPAFQTLKTQKFVWSSDFIEYVVKNREKIKEEFANIMFN